eukprot:comp6885_c0_seq1/m.2633 comp6885_c0_seq1/g.2633  ORF comp6885_c0_seq1/g.2633 comp6885_c0_seq1/m.2633 type:complete len:337 (-) comp6885_c0_seq1:87-1097(-)
MLEHFSAALDIKGSISKLLLLPVQVMEGAWTGVCLLRQRLYPYGRLFNARIWGCRFFSAATHKGGHPSVLDDVVSFRDSAAEYHLLGTIHRDQESAQHVQHAVSTLHPDVVVVELSRQNPTATTKRNNTQTPWGLLAAGDPFGAVTELRRKTLFSERDAQSMPDMAMALSEATKVGAMVMYADRPSEVTLRRFYTRLPTNVARWSFLWRLLTARSGDTGLIKGGSIGEQQKRDLLEAHQKGVQQAMFSNTLSDLVFVHERNLCFVSVMRWASDGWSVHDEGRRKVVLGVFGKAHIPGIQAMWHENFDEDAIFEVGDTEHWKQTDVLWWRYLAEICH